jgi:two-component system sensor kinase FixL
LHILVNLLRNAAESMTSPGEVTITATRDKGGVHMQVRDTGNGIPDALLPNLFEPFMSEPGKTRPGLGLAIIRDLVRRHGGEVTARNWEHGAEFDLYFPDCPTDDDN